MSHPRRPRSFSAAVALGTVTGLLGSLIVATPAFAITRAEVNPDPTQWAATPYSPLPWDDVVPPAEGMLLNFDVDAGGMPDGSPTEIGTGFTMVQPSTGPGPGFEQYYHPENLSVSGGKLNITATKGIAYLGATNNTDNQDNTLGVALDAIGKKYYLTTTLSAPANAASSAQAGLWFGPNDDNFLKFVLAAPNATERQIQISKEIDGVSNNAGTAARVDQINFNSTAIGTQPVKLELVIDAVTGTATGTYTIGSGTATNLGTLTGIPANFFDGSTLLGEKPESNPTSSFAGVFATKRNMLETTSVVWSFDEFAIAEVDATAPAAPTAFEANPGLAKVDLTWQAPADTDLAGYRVYRSSTTPVALTGTPLSGTALLTEPNFTDTQTFGRVGYHYAVVAVDKTNNVSAAATAGPVTTDAPAGEPVVAFDFTTPAGTAAAGYEKDAGAPYTDAAGFGWKNSAGDPVDISGQTRVRGTSGVEPRLDSIVHLHPNTPLAEPGHAAVPYSWQYDLPNGTYAVVVAAGDSGAGISNGFDSTHVLRAEGQTILDGFVGSNARLYDEAVLTDVIVEDGSLTIDAVGGTNTKISYLEIYRQGLAAPEAPEAPANLGSTLTGKDVTLTWDTVEDAVGYKIFRSVGETVDTTGDALATVETAGYSDTATEWDTTYTYAVVAVSAENAESAASEPETVVIPEFVDPNPPQLCAASEWQVEYFAGTALAGDPLEVICSIAIDQTYPVGAKPDQVPEATNYSIRWTKTIDQGAGSYQISTRTDDGVRVKIDDQVVVNRWFAQAADATYTTTVPLTAGPHKIEVEYYQSFGAASAKVTVQKSASVCAATEWRAEYFNGTSLSGSPVADDCVDAIDLTLAAGEAPSGLEPQVGTDLYSIRWTRTINEGAGTYEFRARTDDGVRIFVDGELVLDKWYDQDGTEQHIEEVQLSAGSHLVTVEYYQGYNAASAQVEYERTSFDSEAPLAPTGVYTDSNQIYIGVNWDASASSDVAGYRVYRSETETVSTTGTPLNGDTLLTGLFYNDTTAEEDVEYWYAVVAVDEAGNASTGSEPARGFISTAPDTEAPDAPAGLTAQAGDGTVALAWDESASADVNGYRVYRGTEPAVATTGTPVSGDAPLTGTTFTDPTVTNGTTYFYVVVAVDLAGNQSVASDEVVAVPIVANTTDVKVDFTGTNLTPAAGYYADWGQAYGVRTGASQGNGAASYGWITEDGNTLSLVGNGRDRGRTGVPELLDSIIHMQYGDVDGGNGTNGVKVDGTWELAVPEGLYEVTVAVGDEMGATSYDSTHVINVEGSVAIEKFNGSASKEYETVTTTVGVWDGKLTVDPIDGVNTKMAYIEVLGIERAPHVDTVLPENRVTGHDVNAGVSATIKVPYAGVGVDPATLNGNVRLYHAGTGVEIPTTVGSSGGNDIISLAPDQPLASNTQYRFVVTSGVKDGRGAAFVPFTSLFTSGTGETTASGEFTPVTGVAFEKVELPTARGVYWSSFAFGPDGMLYANSIGQGLWRFPVNEDGTLGTGENLGYEGVAQIGLVFDKSATADNLKLWVTRTSANFSEQGQWVSSIHLLSGPDLATDRSIFTSLPRSLSDHLTNSMAYGPDGRIYFLQGSNQAAGDLDGAWGQRGEQLLTAATLVFDPAHPQVQTAANGGASIDVKTAQGGTYNPYAADAPLKIFATGIRNAYDLVWHSNNHLYVPTNGTAGGANTPGVTANADGTFTREAAAGIPGFSTVDGQDVTEQCVRRGYTGGSVPPTGNIGTQRDLLFDVVQGGYYGHPNPERCEWVLNAGSGNAEFPVLLPTKYPAGTNPDPNYRGIAYDFEFNKSPNGALEYKSSTFGGQLQGRLLVVRFSNNNDIAFLQPDPVTGKILGAQYSVGITGIPNSTIGGVDGFNDPLEVVEDPNTGNLYVNQYDRSGSDQRMFLLRVPSNQQAAAIQPSVSELVFSAVKSSTNSAAKTFTVTNNRTEPVQLSTALTGANAAEFQVTGGDVAIPGKGSVTLSVSFRPSATVGQKAASLQLTADGSSVSVGLYGLTMNGIEGNNEPTLNDVMGTLGYKINVGWTNLAGGMEATAKGDEILEPLFVKAGTADPTMTPLAQYAPREDLPFGWYTGDGQGADQHKLGSIDISGYQSLLPPMSPGSTPSFDPGTAEFGFYYYSNTFGRTGFTEDRLNSPASDAHRARIYPAKNRSGVAITNAYIVAFEDASNGDYQDYVFLVTGVKPVTDTGSVDGAIKVDFTTATGDLAAGYLRDYGQAYGARTGANQGSGLSYGWKDAQTENDVDLSVGGTAGNGRDRGTSQPDMRLDSFMHMQGAMVPNFNGNPVNAYWQIALPDGEYQVTVAVGDPAVNSDPEIHQINLEEQPLINLFEPTGVAGSATRHATATKTLTVSDGFLTVDATNGTNTKIAYIDIVPVETETPGGDDPTNGAQVKVNFQTVNAPTPEGWTADSGAAYSDDAGFGWVDTTGTPVVRSSTDSFRYRTAPANGIAFPTDPLLQTFAFLQTNPGPANWEYEVPNGTYEVSLSVGDAHFLDSTHSVTAEGQPVVNSFVPTTTTPFQTGRRTITVSDGKLTISGTGTNTKINWVSIKGDDLEQPGGPQPTAMINYQTTDATTPTGWQADTGAAFSEARGYGWLVNEAPADRSNATRYRPTATAGIAFPTNDMTRQTLILTQAGAVSGITDGVWEYALANGTYTVSVSVGDPGYLDSTHGVAAENTSLITGFVPTGTTPFATGTAEVVVSDGRLTLTPTGNNTKFNWVTIAGAAMAAPSITVSANGQQLGTDYNGGPATVTVEATASGDATIETLRYTLDNGVPLDVDGPITISELGTHVLQITAVDTEGRETIRTVTFLIEDIGGTVTLRNQQATRQGADVIPGFSEDVLVMQRINSGVTTHLTIDQATVTVNNTGTKNLKITDLGITGAQAAQFELVDPPATPLVIEPGESQNLTVKFIADSGTRGIRTANLAITSSDPASAVTNVQLRGGYMTAPEGNSELTLQEISNLFGWTTDIGNLQNGDEMHTSALDGDEVRTLQWKRMDTGAPVSVRQLGAFHGCCTQTETISLNGSSSTQSAPYGQSILPLTSAGNPVQLSTSPNGNFNFTVAGQTTNNSNYMALKTWPVYDAAGSVVPGAWLVGHDYISSPNQCGIAPTNCDFQDNVYLITNMLPVSSSDTTAPAAPSGLVGEVVDETVELDWTASTSADVSGYVVERATAAAGPWTRISPATPLQGTSFTDSSVPFADSAFYRILAVDASSNASTASNVAEVDLSGIANRAIRFRAGTTSLTTGGATWLPDTSYAAGGGLYTNPSVTQIAGTTDDALYLTERSEAVTFGYNVPLESGTYQVKLHFAEIYWGATGGGAGGTGKRVFDVNYEGGAAEIVNLDLNARVAPMTALILTDSVAVTDGNLDIDFAASVNFPAVQAVEIVRTGDAPVAPSAPTGVTAALSDSNVQVSWTASASTSVLGYRVERATSATGPWTVISASGTSTSFMDTAVPFATDVFYRVTAIGDGGLTSPPSASASVAVGALYTPTNLSATSGTGSVALTWTAAAGNGVTGYHVERAADANGPWTRVNGTSPIAGTSYTHTDAPAGAAFYRVIATNAAGTLGTPTAAVSVTVAEAETPSGDVIRINAGGPAVSAGGDSWLADTYFTGGKSYSNAQVSAIAGTTADAIYTTERSSTSNLAPFGYNVPLPSGSYTVRLHFAEIYWGATGGGAGGTGKRVFSVNLEGGATEVTNLDLNAQVAPMTAYITSNTLNVTDGNLDIDFTATIDQPKVSAIEIIRNTGTPPAQQPVRINTGGGAVTTGGVAWQADTLFTGGKSYSNGSVTQIAGTTADALYLNERSATTNLGSFGYNIPLADGTYTVRFHFAEIYHGATGGGAGGTGKRVFSVNLEGGATEVTNLDLNAQVAPMTAYIVTREIAVTDGNLDVDFTASVNQPTIAAIEVLPGAPVAPAAPAAPTNVGATASGANNVVTWTASTDGVAGYHVERATSTAGPWTRLTSGPAVAGTTFTDTSASALQVAVYRVLALSSEGVLSAPSGTATVSRFAPIRINTGGGAVTAGGASWTADAFFSGGGKAYTNPSVTAIGGTTADAIYLNERSTVANLGSYSYDIPVPNGTYTVRLHHAEIYHGATGGGPGGTGKRVFNVNFEGGSTEITGRDINAAVGPMNAYVTSHNVTVSGGVLDIDFAATVDQPSIAAIEVLGGADSTVPVPGGAVIGGASTAGGTQTATGGGTLTATDGGTLTATGGGPLTATGGGTQTATGGGPLTATGGGTQRANSGGTLTATGGGKQTAPTAGGTQTATGGATQTATGGATQTATGGRTQTVAEGSVAGGTLSSPFLAPVSSSPFTAPSAPFTAAPKGFAAPLLTTKNPVALQGVGSSPFSAPSLPFATPGASASGTTPAAPVAGTHPQVRNTVQPGEMRVFGEDGFVVRVDVLAAFLLSLLILSTVMARRMHVRQHLAAAVQRLRARTSS